MPAATGVRWRPRTSVTAPPSRSQWRVSEWKKKLRSPLATDPRDSMHGVDTMGILMSCFSRYSRATGGAHWYSVCFQEGVSAAEVVWSVTIKGPWKKCMKKIYSLTLSFCVTGIVCKLAHQVQKNYNLRVSRWTVFSHETRRFYFFMSNFLHHKPTWLS